MPLAASAADSADSCMSCLDGVAAADQATEYAADPDAAEQLGLLEQYHDQSMHSEALQVLRMSALALEVAAWRSRRRARRAQI